jgi:hypothetical protein
MENRGGMMSTGETPDSSTKPTGNATSSHLVEKQEELAKEMNFALRYIFVHTSKGLLTCRKVFRRGADGSAADFYSLKNPSPSAGFEPAKLGSNSKDANHYTTEDDTSLFCLTACCCAVRNTHRVSRRYYFPD